MWPLLLDMTKDESLQSLRNLELEAYSNLVSALRAQGPLSTGKRQLLRETSAALNISQERHKAEIRRALTDEKLTTIAYHVNAQHEYNNEWAQEGRRVIPLMPRMAPQTAFSTVADELTESADQKNKLLPLPANTERMMVQSNQNISVDSNKISLYRVHELTKPEEIRKRKPSESSSLAHHLLGPSSKLSKIQQIYRQKTKSSIKEGIGSKADQEQQTIFPNKASHQVLNKKSQAMKIPKNSNSSSATESKINILQNINLKQPSLITSEDRIDQYHDTNNTNSSEFNESNQKTSPATILNENNRLKLFSKSNIMFQSSNTSPGAHPNMNSQKNIKMSSSKKSNIKTLSNTSQKLIVVSNAQTIPNNSILQKTLTIPFMKNISLKNFDKFKIVTSSGTPITLANSTVNSNNFNSVKHKVVTVRTGNSVSAGKKMLPLTQLQMLNQGSIKVLPLGGKIISTTTTSPIMSSMYIVNSTQNKLMSTLPIATPTKILENTGNTQEAIISSEESTSNYLRNSEKLLESNLLLINKLNSGSVKVDCDNDIEEFQIHSVPVTSGEAVTDVNSEEMKFNEMGQANEGDKSAILCFTELECSSDGEAAGTTSRISPERKETELKVYTNGSNRIENFSDHSASASHIQESDVQFM